jgi:WD40 repeat protein
VYGMSAFAPKSTLFQAIYAKSTSFPHATVSAGLKDDWPSQVTINAHYIRSQSLSICGNSLVTGGNSGSHPVFGVWDIQQADGKIYTHPCGTLKCSVSDVFFYEDEEIPRLMTWCRCGVFCIWDPSMPLEFLQGARYSSNVIFRKWSESCNRTITILNEGHRIQADLWDKDSQSLRILWTGDVWDITNWIFSPRYGTKLAKFNDASLVVWNCVELQELFKKQWDTKIGGVEFVPNSETILVSVIDSYTEMIVINCLSTQDGTPLWGIEQAANIRLFDSSGFSVTTNFHFFPDGKKFVLVGEALLLYAKVINAVDGSILAELPASHYSRFSNIFIHPDGDRMFVVDSSGTQTTYFSPNLEVQQHGFKEPSKALRSLSWKHHILTECSTDRITFLSIDQTFPTISRPPDHYIRELLFSPNGAYLAISSGSGTEIWECSTGTSLFSGIQGAQMEFDSDSSILLAWTAAQEPVQIIDIEKVSMTLLRIPDLAMAAHFPSSNQLLTISQGGRIRLHSLDGLSNKQIGQLSFNLNRDLSCSLITAIDGTRIAMIHNGSLIVKELLGDNEEKVDPGAYRCVSFGSDPSYALAIECHTCSRDPNYIVSFLRLSDMVVINQYIHDMGRHYWLEIYPRSFFDVYSTYSTGRSNGISLSSFDNCNGKRILPASLLYVDDSLIRYGQYFLLDLGRDIDRFNFNTLGACSGVYVAWSNKGQVSIIDMSLMIDYM